MKNYLLLALAAVALFFTACKKDNPEPTPVAVTDVSLDKTMVGLEIGESATVQAVITPSNATNKAVEWSVADTAVATVANGVVTGVAVGETTLTATTADGGHTATIPVKVVTEKVAVTGIEWQQTTSNTKEGKFAFFVAEISPANATFLSTTWMSDNPEVASIGEIKIADNLIMAYIWGVAPGKATISVTTDDGGFKRYCPITIDPIVKVTEINLLPKSAIIEIGQTEQFAAAIIPGDADNREVEWSSSDTSVATVKVTSNNHIAEVTGVGKGTATITATAKDGSGVKGETTVTIVGKKPTSIIFDGTAPYEFNYWQGKVIDFKNDLKMKVEPADADFSRIEWGFSINSARADVSAEDVKYEVKDNNITLSYAHSTQWVAAETVSMTAYVDYEAIGIVSIIMQNRGMLLYTASLSPYYDLAMHNTMNWDNDNTTELRYICYNKMVGSDGKYDEYQIPSSEYTLTSSDESKIKVTKNDDGISWMVERLNTTDLAAVTLTYKCGDHTQTYTINLIP